MREFLSRARQLAYYTYAELAQLGIAALVVGFVFSFDKWGYITFDANVGLFNWLQYAAYAFITLFAMDVCRKLYSAHLGIRTEYRLWFTGILTAIAVAFITNGAWYVLFIGGFAMHYSKPIHYGKVIKDFGIWEPAKIGFVALLGAFFVGALLSVFMNVAPYLREALIVNAVLLAFHAFPIDILGKYFDARTPLSYGSALLIGSRVLSIFALLLFVLSYVSFFLVGLMWFLIICLFLATAGTIMYLYSYELEI